MGKPQVGIASMWYEGNPCNMHLLRLAEEVKKGVVRTRATPRMGRRASGAAHGAPLHAWGGVAAAA